MENNIKCTAQGCDNEKFGDQKECALHCVKGKRRDDDHKGILSAFHDNLVEYILNQIAGNIGDRNTCKAILTGQSIDKELVHIQKENDRLSGKPQKLSLPAIEFSTDNFMKADFRKQEINFGDIKFPDRDHRDSYDYFKLFNYFGGLSFTKCEFNNSSLDEFQKQNKTNNVKFFFDECIFNNNWRIKNIQALDDINAIYQDCHFKKGISTNQDPNGNNYIIDEQLFFDCKFEGVNQLHHTDFQEQVFNNSSDFKNQVNTLEIVSCTFNKKFILNNHPIDSFICKDSIFNNKFELKESSISDFKIDNCNFYKVTDFYGSNFIKFNITKSIFDDFVGFEKCTFGNSEFKDDNPAIYKYTTFKNFINFRNTNFNNGLDIEDINLKEPPNFLGIFVNPHGTNQETFRIIKHSFDSIGNNIEGNKFFKYEMIKYQEKLKKSGSKKERFVFWFNNGSSDFGQDYILPIKWMLLLSVIYGIVICGYKKGFFTLNNSENMFNNFLIFLSNLLNGLAGAIIPFGSFLPADDNIKFVSLLFGIFQSILLYQVIIALKRLTKR